MQGQRWMQQGGMDARGRGGCVGLGWMQRDGMQEVGMQEVGMQRDGMREVGMWDIGMQRDGMREVGMREVGMQQVGMQRDGMRKVGMWDIGMREVGMREVGMQRDGRTARRCAAHRAPVRGSSGTNRIEGTVPDRVGVRNGMGNVEMERPGERKPFGRGGTGERNEKRNGWNRTERGKNSAEGRDGTERPEGRNGRNGGWENTGIAAKLRCGSERGARDGGVFRLTERNGTGTGTARTAPGSAPSPAAAPAALRSSAVPSLGSREGIPARLFLDGPHGTGCGEGILGGKGGGSGRYLRNRARVGGRAEPPERSWR